MSTASTRNLGITDGPAAHIIWAAAQFAYNKEIEIKVDFTLNVGLPQREGVMWQHISPQITGVQHEDGSGQSLLIRGFLDGEYFEGWYDARKRSGFINLNR